jgi:carbon storage regulator CsrA
MLVLSRREHERIVLPDVGVVVELLGVKGNSARLGIEAPPELKVLREELLEAPAPASPPAPDGRHAMPQFPFRALVVDDDRNECELLAGFLRAQGIQVATAGDGADALGYLGCHEKPDVVLLDMIMPVCDGPSTLRAIRQSRELNDLRVVAVSGTSPATWGITTGPEGVDGWFPKPLDPQNLLTGLQRCFVGKPR